MIITDERALRVVCEDVLPEEVDQIRTQLEYELKNSSGGIGLAAPQIGIAKRMAIVRVNGTKIDLVNCRVTQGYDEKPFKGEGCLSFPGQFITSMRYREIVVVENLVEPHTFVATDLVAIAVQHELDHLSGRLLPDIMINDHAVLS